MEYIVGIGEYIISTKEEDIVKTFALSTCVAIVIYDINKKILAMAHILLPNTINDNKYESHNSAIFADKAVYNILKEMTIKYNCRKQDLRVSLFGGINSESKDYFKIGERNLAVVKCILDKMNVGYNTENTGGRVSRTITAYTVTGKVYVKAITIADKEK